MDKARGGDCMAVSTAVPPYHFPGSQIHQHAKQACLQRPAPNLAPSWSMKISFRRGVLLPELKYLPMPELFVQWDLCWTCSLGILLFGYVCTRKGYLCDQPSIKTPDTQSGHTAPSMATSHPHWQPDARGLCLLYLAGQKNVKSGQENWPGKLFRENVFITQL